MQVADDAMMSDAEREDYASERHGERRYAKDGERKRAMLITYSWRRMPAPAAMLC